MSPEDQRKIELLEKRVQELERVVAGLNNKSQLDPNIIRTINL